MDDNATLQGDFADDSVLVVLDNEESLRFNEYTPSDFSNINCISVTNLMPYSTAMVKAQIENATNASATDISIDVSSFEQILCIKLAEGGKDKVAAAIKTLQGIEGVKYAGPDYIMTLCNTTPNDYPTNATQKWALEKIQMPKAWDITTGSNSVIVGVIDSGIQGTHPDLSQNINNSLCRDFTSGVEVAEYSPTDPFNHGTSVAGIIGAKGNNNIGMSGVCWNVQLVSLKAFGTDRTGKSSNTILAIDYARRQNIPLLNLSAAWEDYRPGFEEYYDEALDTAILNYPGLIVCAAGNGNRSVEDIDIYPVNCSYQNKILCVGASTQTDEKQDDSNFGPTAVDIFAPGENIYTCTTTGYASGFYQTSAATPFVTGVAALMLSMHPTLTALEIKEIIIATADYSAALNGKCVSNGRLNAYDALRDESHYGHHYSNVGSTHYSYCTCNQYIEESHTYGVSYTSAGNKHRSNCVCGAYIEESHTFVQNGSVVTCTKCNQQVILQGVEPDLEIE